MTRSKAKKIGILGGTFNPPHIGHMVLAQEALCQLKLDKVIFIPAYLPPHKKVKGNDASRRLQMTRLACKGNSRFEVSDIEIRKRAVSYSIETVKLLKRRRVRDADVFFITGSDSLGELKTWREVDEFLALINFVVANRPGFPLGRRRSLFYIKIPPVGVSSSDIRRRVRLSKSIRYLVPEPVRIYIESNGLYRK